MNYKIIKEEHFNEITEIEKDYIMEFQNIYNILIEDKYEIEYVFFTRIKNGKSQKISLNKINYNNIPYKEKKYSEFIEVIKKEIKKNIKEKYEEIFEIHNKKIKEIINFINNPIGKEVNIIVFKHFPSIVNEDSNDLLFILEIEKSKVKINTNFKTKMLDVFVDTIINNEEYKTYINSNEFKENIFQNLYYILNNNNKTRLKLKFLN